MCGFGTAIKPPEYFGGLLFYKIVPRHGNFYALASAAGKPLTLTGMPKWAG